MDTDIVLEAPGAVTFSDGAMENGNLERDARLLVAGEYPAKALTVTEGDLDQLVAHFSGPIPVKVEHVDSPLDPLGLVTRVWRQGRELMGRVSFPKELAAFLSQRNAHKLSVGLLKEPAWRLLEASLTLTPHVPTATLLSDGERVELAELRSQVRRQSVDAQIAELRAAGKVVPATEPFARALLGADDGAVVTLSDGVGEEPTARVFRRLLDAQPPLVHLSELAPAQAGRATLSGGASGAAGSAEMEREFTAEEREIMRRLGVTPEDVRATMAQDAGQRKKA